ncbi:hypothetical protein OG244_07390 [Streptomyces brevispora]|uniref:hypothetical protein n=1 Tax=Streptomyces brevispora TaxID=887462 RepID=UPI002E32E1F9|nr:hypothetical protein [Streptomyces brevispora]
MIADPGSWADLGIVKADLLGRAGRLDAAADELRALGTIKAREALCEILILEGRAAEAVTVHPTVTNNALLNGSPPLAARTGIPWIRPFRGHFA